MSSPNFVLLEGYVSRNAELREVGNNGATILAFSVGVSKGRDSDGESLGTSYFDIDFWNPSEKLADSIIDASEDEDSSLKLSIRGRLNQDRWENEDGESRSRVKIVASTISIPNYSENNDNGGKKGKKKKKKKGSSKKKSSRPTNRKSSKKSRKATNTGRKNDDDFDEDEDDDEDDVPF